MGVIIMYRLLLSFQCWESHILFIIFLLKTLIRSQETLSLKGPLSPKTHSKQDGGLVLLFWVWFCHWPSCGPSTLYPGSLTFLTVAVHPTGTLSSWAFCLDQIIALSLLGHSCKIRRPTCLLKPKWLLASELVTGNNRDMCVWISSSSFFFFSFETGPSFGTLELRKCPLVWIEKSQLLVTKQRSLCVNSNLCILKTLSVIY